MQTVSHIPAKRCEAVTELQSFSFKPTLYCFELLVLELHKPHFSFAIWLPGALEAEHVLEEREGTCSVPASTPPPRRPSSLVAVFPVSSFLLLFQNQPYPPSSPSTPNLPPSARQRPLQKSGPQLHGASPRSCWVLGGGPAVPGGPVVRTPSSHCQGPGFSPWSGN